MFNITVGNVKEKIRTRPRPLTETYLPPPFPEQNHNDQNNRAGAGTVPYLYRGSDGEAALPQGRGGQDSAGYAEANTPAPPGPGGAGTRLRSVPGRVVVVEKRVAGAGGRAGRTVAPGLRRAQQWWQWYSCYPRCGQHSRVIGGGGRVGSDRTGPDGIGSD